MSKEISGINPSGTAYARIKNKNGQFWNGATFEDYSSGNYLTYKVTMTREGTTQEWTADFPALITTSGTYSYLVHRYVSSPAETDVVVGFGTVDWTGTSSASAAAGSMSASDWRNYVLRGGFKRTDKDTEIYEETTDAIQEMRRRFMFDEAEADTTTTDTISVLGDFKVAVESDFGLVLGIILQDGTNAQPLNQLSKKAFDDLYPYINVDTNRGYPRDYTIYAGQIYIGPIPDRVSFTYRISYSSRAGTVTASTTGVPFTRDYRDILRDNVLGRLYKGLDDFDKAAVFKQNFELDFDQAKTRERRNSGSSTFNVKPFGM